MPATSTKRVVVRPGIKKLYASIIIVPGKRPEITQIGERRFLVKYRDAFNSDSDLTGIRCVLRPVTWKLAKPFSAKGGAV